MPKSRKRKGAKAHKPRCPHTMVHLVPSTFRIDGGPVRKVPSPYVACRKCSRSWSQGMYPLLKREGRL